MAEKVEEDFVVVPPRTPLALRTGSARAAGAPFRVSVVATGTSSHVAPVIYFAAALSRQEGYTVDLITHGAHQALASQAGISVHTRLNGNPDSFLSHKTYIDAATSGDPKRLTAALKEFSEYGWLQDNLPWLWKACKGTEAILCGHANTLECSSIARRLQVPVVVLSSVPIYPSSSGFDAAAAGGDPSLLGWGMPGVPYEKAGHLAASKLRVTLSSFQRQVLKMPESSSFAICGLPHLVAVPTPVLPRPPSWPDFVLQTEFWHPPEPPNDAVHSAVVELLGKRVEGSCVIWLVDVPTPPDQQAGLLAAATSALVRRNRAGVVVCDWEAPIGLSEHVVDHRAATTPTPPRGVPLTNKQAGDEGSASARASASAGAGAGAGACASAVGAAGSARDPSTPPASSTACVLVVGSRQLPLLWAASHCDVLVHSGSTLSTAAALTGGATQVVFPAVDHQLFWAKRALALGVTAPPVTPISEVELNTTFLQRRMEQCNTRFTRAAARELARSLAASSSDGLAKAVHALESLFVQSRFRNAGVECEWEPDKERDSCGQCHKPFTLFRRRHHCRSCGLLICSACETSQALPGYPCTDPQSVCLECADDRVGMEMRRRSDADVGRKMLLSRSLSSPAATCSPVLAPHMTCSSEIMSSEMLTAVERALWHEHRGHAWVLVYSLVKHGASKQTMVSKMRGIPSTIFIVETTGGERFGGFAGSVWHETGRYGGTAESFVFTMQPTGTNVTTYKWAGRSGSSPALKAAANKYFMYLDHDGIGLGGGHHFAFFVDSALLNGSSGYCDTFASPCLLTGAPKAPADVSEERSFQVANLEVWGLKDQVSGGFR